MVVEADAARAFATAWIAAWNAHDLDRILEHYAEDVEFTSPYVVRIAGEPSGTLIGKHALRAYWAKGLAMLPDLHFTPIETLVGVDAVTLVYRGHRGVVAETFRFDPTGRVCSATACYGLEERPPTSLPDLRLIGRSSSHFTRVAAIFAHELGLPFELSVVHDLTSVDTAAFGGNPALKVPTLHVGTSSVFGTENICRTLVELAGRAGDPRIVLTESIADTVVRSAQELVWSAMSAQVQLRVGLSVANLPADSVFFVKAAAGLTLALTWLEQRLDDVRSRLPASRALSLFEVTLFCLVEHVAFRPTVSIEPFVRLREFASTFGERASARRTPFRFDPAPSAPKETP